MKHSYVFEIVETGEQIIVEEKSLVRAYEKIEELIGMECEFVDEVSFDEAEMLGYDTY